MSLILDDGTQLRFGQDLREVEAHFSRQAHDIPMRIARPGIDKQLELETFSLEFDSGRLRKITLKAGYKYFNPPTPYSESWKNFPSIGSRKISEGMPRRAFLVYLAAWKRRAANLGAKRTQVGDFSGQQFSVSFQRDSFVDMVLIDMGPSRRARGGGIWCDGWIATFALPDSPSGTVPGTLESLSAFRDEFNSVARKTL
jgi:hypothetical protein